jgi:hypothetical protein
MLTFGPLSRDTGSKKPLWPSGKKNINIALFLAIFFLVDILHHYFLETFASHYLGRHDIWALWLAFGRRREMRVRHA